MSSRKEPAVDQEQLLQTIIRFSHLVTAFPEILEFEINPLLATPGGVLSDPLATVRSYQI